MPTRKKTALKPVSVLVAESSRMAGMLLADALQKSPYAVKVVSCVQTSDDLVRAANHHNPQIAILSTNLEDGHLTGMRALHQLRAAHPKTLVILLTDSPDRELVVEAFRAGARGIFSRSDPVMALAKCTRAVLSGQIWANARELQFLLEALSQGAAPRLTDSKGKALLTKREQEVVELVSEGLTNKEISHRLKLSEHTIKNYLFRLFEKLGVSSRIELILYAFRQRSPVSFGDDPEIKE